MLVSLHQDDKALQMIVLCEETGESFKIEPRGGIFEILT